MNNSRIAAYLLPVALGAGGCVTYSAHDALKQKVASLERRIGVAETKPYVEAPTGIPKSKYPEAFSALLGVVAPMYQNGQARATAESRANLIEIYPTNERGKYKVVVGEDVNGDGKLTEGIDFTLADIRDKKYIADFRVPEELLLKIIRSALPAVKEYQHPIQPQKQQSKPFIRREPAYMRRQVRLPVKR